MTSNWRWRVRRVLTLILAALFKILIWSTTFVSSSAVGSRTLPLEFLLLGTASFVSILFNLIEVSAILSLSSSHANIASYADSATLLGHSSAEGRALSKSWELLRTVDRELGGLDFHSPIERRVRRAWDSWSIRGS